MHEEAIIRAWKAVYKRWGAEAAQDMVVELLSWEAKHGESDNPVALGFQIARHNRIDESRRIRAGCTETLAGDLRTFENVADDADIENWMVAKDLLEKLDPALVELAGGEFQGVPTSTLYKKWQKLRGTPVNDYELDTGEVT
jgi:hypothetical protein